MTIQDLGSIGELIAALATVATLLYLALQIRHNSEVVRTSNYWQLSSQFGEFSQQLSQNPELMEIYQRGIVDYSRLSELEQGRFHMLITNLFSTYQLMAQLELRGLIDSDMYHEQFDGVRELLKLPGVAQWWAAAEHWYGPTFRAFIRDGIAKSAQ